MMEGFCLLEADDVGVFFLEPIKKTFFGDCSDTVNIPRDELHGPRHHVALARALLHDPDVILLDEPFTGLDQHAAEVLRNQLRVLKDGRRAVVLVTHNLTEGVELADDVVIQVRGRFVVEIARADIPDGFQMFYRETVDGAA